MNGIDTIKVGDVVNVHWSESNYLEDAAIIDFEKVNGNYSLYLKSSGNYMYFIGNPLMITKKGENK